MTLFGRASFKFMALNVNPGSPHECTLSLLFKFDRVNKRVFISYMPLNQILLALNQSCSSIDYYTDQYRFKKRHGNDQECVFTASYNQI